jgi:predicted hotdog family 3-hydroxylacyl-ACP dehydratase
MTNQTDRSTQLPYPAEDLLIHTPPMLLIDELIEREGDRAAASARILPNDICFDDKRGILPEFFIEIMAQTIAAANGYDCLLEGTQPRDGFIVGLDKFVLKHIPDIESFFLIKVEKTMEFGPVKVMQGEVFNDGISIASGEIKVWEQEENED